MVEGGPWGRGREGCGKWGQSCEEPQKHLFQDGNLLSQQWGACEAFEQRTMMMTESWRNYSGAARHKQISQNGILAETQHQERIG